MPNGRGSRRDRRRGMRRAADFSRAQRHRESRERQVDSTAERGRRPRTRWAAQGQQDSNHDGERNSCDADRGIHDSLDARVCASDSSRDSRAGSPRVDALGRFHGGRGRYSRADTRYHRLRLDRQGNGAARGGIWNEGARAEAQPVGSRSMPDGVRRVSAIPTAKFRRVTSVPKSAKQYSASPTTCPSLSH